MENYKQTGKAFIAYKGTELSHDEIIRELRKECDDSYEVKFDYNSNDNVIFAKVVNKECKEDSDPFYYDYEYEDRDVSYPCDHMTVSGYIQSEMEKANKMFSNYEITDKNKQHELVNFLYQDFDTGMFEKLSDLHFSTVVWCEPFGKIIAGVTEPTTKYTHLFYGYTRKNHEIIFSNDRKMLINFCDEVKEMKNNTYIISMDDEVEFFKIKEENVNSEEESQKDNNGVNDLVDNINSLILQFTTESVKNNVEKNAEKVLTSDKFKKQMRDYLLKELNEEAKKQVLEATNHVLEDIDVEDRVSQNIHDVFQEKLEEYSKQINVPTINIIKLRDTELGRTEGGFYHEKFEEVLSLVQLDEPVMLIGPAGSGKNYSIEQISKALGLKMYYTNNASNEFKLTGFIDAGGNYRDTEFYKAFKNGGVFFLDEIDNSDPSALIVINSALANGYMAFPHETIDRHPDFRMVAAANTWGKGSDLQYVGRNILDGATLDRFDNVFYDYDRRLEESLYPNEEILEFMWSFRDAVEESKIPHIVSTRGIGKVYKKEINGIPVETILRTNIIKNLGQDDLNTILGCMENIDQYNKFYTTTKTLKLR